MKYYVLYELDKPDNSLAATWETVTFLPTEKDLKEIGIDAAARTNSCNARPVGIFSAEQVIDKAFITLALKSNEIPII